ncbi:Gfo/Idh/MocA family oxidoreductase, partial [Streptomyces sp. E2N171]
AVAVALPPAVQADLAVRAARAGRHLLLDKPIATTVAQGRAVVEAADAA